MDVLVTGVSGFVGSHLSELIISKGVNVHGLMRWRSPVDNIHDLLLSPSFTPVYGDLMDMPSLMRIFHRYHPDVIYHLAAQSYVPYSFDAPVSTLSTNIIGTCNLLECIKSLKISSEYNYDPTIVLCSSSEVYGQVSPTDIPIKESAPLRPASPYAVSKVAEDLLGYQYWLSWALKIIRVRLFTHTGPRRGDVFASSNFAKQISLIERGCARVIKVGNLNSIRTFLDVRDAAKAYWLVKDLIPGEVYNIGGTETMSIGEMLEILMNLSSLSHDYLHTSIQVDDKRLRPSDVTLQIPSVKKFTNATHWRPLIPIKDTLRDLLNYWRDKVSDYDKKKDHKLTEV